MIGLLWNPLYYIYKLKSIILWSPASTGAIRWTVKSLVRAWALESDSWVWPLFQLLSISPPYLGLPAPVPTLSGKTGSCDVPTWLAAGRNFFQRQKGQEKTVGIWSALSLFCCDGDQLLFFGHPSSMGRAGAFCSECIAAFFPPYCVACRILIHWSGIKPRLPALEGEVLAVKS